jgi:hypothetical protein
VESAKIMFGAANMACSGQYFVCSNLIPGRAENVSRVR